MTGTTKGVGHDRVSQLAARALEIVSHKPEGGANQAATVRRVMDLALDVGGCSVEEMLATLRAERVSDRALVETYIPAAARELGKCWEYDTLAFSQVTLASTRLQSMLNEMLPEWELTSHRNYDAQRQALLLVVPHDEQHTLGAMVLRLKLRQKGYSVRLAMGWSTRRIGQVLRAEPFAAVIFSCPRSETLEKVARTIIALTASGLRMPATLAGGAVFDGPNGPTSVPGVDLVSNELASVDRLCRSGAPEQSEAAE